MMNAFRSSNEDTEVRLKTIDALVNGYQTDAIVAAARRFTAGDVPGQHKRNAPAVPEFVSEVRNQQELIDLRSRPRMPTPQRTGPSPFEINKEKALRKMAGRPVLRTNVSHEEYMNLSRAGSLPSGATWIACLATIYGPKAQGE